MKKRILIVDDSASILEMASTMLRLLGYDHSPLRDGGTKDSGP